MKFKYILPLLIITNFAAVAQQVIEFYSLSGSNTLTQEDVNKILEEEWLGSDFTAKIHDNITVIGKMAFYADTYFDSANPANQYLVKLNAVNVETIESRAFTYCFRLSEFYLPETRTIDTGAFIDCNALTVIELPKVIKLGESALRWSGVSSVSFGLGFTEPTEIIFEYAVFVEGRTKVMDLVLSEFVLPAPDLDARIWQDFFGNEATSHNSYPYEWKSIKIFVGVEDKIENENIFCIGKNIYSVNDVSTTLELYDIMGNKLATFNNQDIIDLNDIKTSGTYFLSYIRKSKLITYKILIY